MGHQEQLLKLLGYRKGGGDSHNPIFILEKRFDVITGADMLRHSTEADFKSFVKEKLKKVRDDLSMEIELL